MPLHALSKLQILLPPAPFALLFCMSFTPAEAQGHTKPRKIVTRSCSYLVVSACGSCLAPAYDATLALRAASHDFLAASTYLPACLQCWDENNCCFAAEADDGAYAGAYIYCSWDAGSTWHQTWCVPLPLSLSLSLPLTHSRAFPCLICSRPHSALLTSSLCLARSLTYTLFTCRNNTQAGASLLDFRVIEGNMGWAVGGIINGLPEASGFLLTTDNGHTWTVDSVLQSSYATSVDCVVETTDCWATVLDATQTASVAYSNQARR